MPWFEHAKQRPAMAVASCALLAALAGCGGGGGSGADPTSTTRTADRGSSTSVATSSSTTSASSARATTTTRPSSATTSPASPAEQEVIERYLGYWDARRGANTGTPNPDDPALREYATGEQLNAVVAETKSNLEAGLAFRQPAEPHDIQRVKVIKIDGDRAVVQECVVADGLVVRRDTGDVVNDEVNTHNVKAEMVKVEGAWKVSAAQLLQRSEGVSGCALAS